MNKNFIKDFISRRRQKDHERRMEDLRSRFNVEEKGGIIWVVYDGAAIMEISPNVDVKRIAEALEMARNSAVKYQSL